MGFIMESKQCCIYLQSIYLTPPPCQNSATKCDAQKREVQRGKHLCKLKLKIKAAMQINISRCGHGKYELQNHCFCYVLYIFHNSLFLFAKLIFFSHYFIFVCKTLFSFEKRYSFAYICGIKLIPY